MLVYDSLKNMIPKILAIKQRENNEFLIVESADLQIFHLNETAKDFIELCDEQRNIDEIVDKLSTIYEVDIELLKNDIIDLIRDLQWKKILTLG